MQRVKGEKAQEQGGDQGHKNQFKTPDFQQSSDCSLFYTETLSACGFETTTILKAVSQLDKGI